MSAKTKSFALGVAVGVVVYHLYTTATVAGDGRQSGGMILLAMKAATVIVALFTGASEAVAVFSVIEIGPNLLAAVTSIIGAVVLLVQLRLARGIRDTREVVKEHHEELKEAVTTADNAKTLATEDRSRIEKLENGDKH